MCGIWLVGLLISLFGLLFLIPIGSKMAELEESDKEDYEGQIGDGISLFIFWFLVCVIGFALILAGIFKPELFCT